MTRIEQLNNALAILAGNADSQIAFLEHIFNSKNNTKLDEMMNVDELALQFDDAMRGLDKMYQIGSIKEELFDHVSRLSKRLTEYSGEENAALWTVKALKTDLRWQRIRLAARECLRFV